MATADKTIRFVVSAGGGSTPAYISDLAPYQVRALQGSYAPTNGTSSLVSAMPSQWTSIGQTDIVRPWSGGAKSTSGTKMYVHGGGHNDSHNNGLYSFDFAGGELATGWATEYAGVPGITTDISVGSVGAPLSVHTYDGMVDMGATLYRFGGSPYPNGGFATQMLRYDKAAATWTRLPNWPAGAPQFSGSAIGNPSAGKILAMDRWVTYQTYAFYRVATNDWSVIKSVAGQWISDGSTAWDPATNTGLMIGSGNGYGVSAFSLTIDWAAETITQTARSLTAVGTGTCIVWDPTRSRYWVWGSASNNSTMYEIDPSTWTVTPHSLTGATLDVGEVNYAGGFGRHVFMDSWRAIGTVTYRNGPAYVIRLP